MSRTRLAAAITPSLDVLRFRTNLRDTRTKHTTMRVPGESPLLLLLSAEVVAVVVFSPLPVVSLLHQLHPVATFHRQLRAAARLEVGLHRVFTSTL